jgi:cell division protein FtsN
LQADGANFAEVSSCLDHHQSLHNDGDTQSRLKTFHQGVHVMATAKKTSTTKATATAAVKVVPAKKATVKKAVKAAAPVLVKTTPVKAAAKPKASAKPKAAPAAKAVTLSLEQRNHYVQVAAFYIAERRGFAAGDPVADWSAAEQEVDRLIASGQFNNAKD